MWRNRKKRMKKWRGSYTVEASFIVPLALWILAIAMRMGIAMHEEIQEQQETLAEMREIEEFYIYQAVGYFVDDQS